MTIEESYLICKSSHRHNVVHCNYEAYTGRCPTISIYRYVTNFVT